MTKTFDFQHLGQESAQELRGVRCGAAQFLRAFWRNELNPTYCVRRLSILTVY